MKYLLILLMLFVSPAFADIDIYVNKNNQTLIASRDGVVLLESKVIIGRDDRQTPNFSDTLTHIVTAPYWNVPYNLAQKDVLPKIRKNPALVRPSQFQILDGSGNNVSQSFINNGLKMQKGWRIRQTNGRFNALGAVKFMLADKMKYGPAIFLHDTNNKELFDEETRRFSSGCIRIDKAVELSELLGVTVTGKKERWHKMAEKVTVHVYGN